MFKCGVSSQTYEKLWCWIWTSLKYPNDWSFYCAWDNQRYCQWLRCSSKHELHLDDILPRWCCMSPWPSAFTIFGPHAWSQTLATLSPLLFVGANLSIHRNKHETLLFCTSKTEKGGTLAENSPQLVYKLSVSGGLWTFKYAQVLDSVATVDWRARSAF